MSGSHKNIAVVAITTMGSRVLGLFRDILLFAAFGTGLVNSAFIMAFTLPNLFRRLLGEGALTSAFVPVFASEVERGGRENAFSVFNQVVTRLLVVLLFLTSLGILGLWFVGTIPGLEDRHYMGVRLAMLLLPYMLLICLSALYAAALNVLERFAVPALSSVWLNLSMIAALGISGIMFGASVYWQVLYLCMGVLVGGALQLAVPAWVLWREGWRPKLDFTPSPLISEVIRLFVPGVLAAGIIQINIVVSRLLAFSISDEAVSVLYLPNRIIELPLGVFTIAVTTVIFPRLSSLVARNDSAGTAKAYAEGFRLVMAISVPAAVGLLLLSVPVMNLFAFGEFGSTDIALTAPVLMIYGLALPFYSLSIYTTRGYHAMKDTKTPVTFAFVAFVLNVLLSLLLMGPYGVKGLACANVVSVVVQSLLLHVGLLRKGNAMGSGRIGPALLKTVGASAVMAVVVYVGRAMTESLILDPRTAAYVIALGLIPVAGVLYFVFLKIFRFEDVDALMQLVLRRK